MREAFCHLATCGMGRRGPCGRVDCPIPRRAYLVTFKIVNQMEAVVYADTADDARRRFDAGEGNTENTYRDYRLPSVKVRRLEDEDR